MEEPFKIKNLLHHAKPVPLHLIKPLYRHMHYFSNHLTSFASEFLQVEELGSLVAYSPDTLQAPHGTRRHLAALKSEPKKISLTRYGLDYILSYMSESPTNPFRAEHTPEGCSIQPLTILFSLFFFLFVERYILISSRQLHV